MLCYTYIVLSSQHSVFLEKQFSSIISFSAQISTAQITILYINNAEINSALAGTKKIQKSFSKVF